MASNFNDPGVTKLYLHLLKEFESRQKGVWANASQQAHLSDHEVAAIIPPHRRHYLAEIVDSIKTYHEKTKHQAQIADDSVAI